MANFVKKKYTGAEELLLIEKIKKDFFKAFASFGFKKIALPMLEPSDLFLRKLGDRIKSQMIYFKDQNDNETCLRPEMTTPVIRSFIENEYGDSLPKKLSYCGKVFRSQSKTNEYEITHIGTEIIGVKSILDDVENIALACSCLNYAGIKKYQITIGNVGILTHLVQHLDVDNLFKNFILERLRNKNNDDDLSQTTNTEELLPDSSSDYKELIRILSKLTPEEEKVLLTKLLNMIHSSFDEELDEAEDIVDGLLTKIKRQNKQESIKQVIEFAKKLQSISGEPAKAIEKVKTLLKEYRVNTSYIKDLEKIIKYLSYYGIAENKIVVDFSLGRQLQYYTGIIFEIDSIGENPLKLCGGGRYDDLIEAIGYSGQLSGCGFAFNLEKVSQIMLDKKFDYRTSTQIKVDIYFIIKNDSQLEQVYSVIQQIRDNGYSLYLDTTEDSSSEIIGEVINKPCQAQYIAVPEQREGKKLGIKLVNLNDQQEEILELDTFLDRFNS